MSQQRRDIKWLLMSLFLAITLIGGHTLTATAAPSGSTHLRSATQIDPNPNFEDDPEDLAALATMQGWIDAVQGVDATYGPQDDTLTQELGSASIYQAGLKLPDFYATATFTNPDTDGPFDFGLGFRFDGEGAFYRVAVQSDGESSFRSVGDPLNSSVGSFNVPVFNAKPGATNRIDLVVSGETGYFAVNNTFVSDLNLSAEINGGEVFTGTGFDADWVTDGAEIAFTGFEVWSLAGVAAPEVASPTAEELGPNAQLIRDWYDEVYHSNTTDNLTDYLSDDFVAHDPPPSNEVSREDYLTQIAADTATLKTAFPDLDYTIEDLIISGDTVVARVVFTGTQTGDLGTIKATGKKVEIEEITIFQIDGEEISELWSLSDSLGLLVQLGVPIGSGG